MHGITIICLIIMMIMLVGTGTKVMMLKQEITDNKCSDIIDAIYAQCIEEGNITISSTMGRNAYLENKFGVCVIRRK